MSRLNIARRLPPIYTHEGAKAVRINPVQQLRRLVLSCLLWEKEFYVDGKTISEQIVETATLCDPQWVASLGLEARKDFNLRHVPLLLLCDLVKRENNYPGFTAEMIGQTISRVDELAELLAVYWRNGRTPLDRQLRRGLARAIRKFDEYQLAKYNRDGDIKLRDVFRIARPKPVNAEQSELWRKVVRGELATPDTWEVALSGGADKKETFERLIREGNLGYFAMIRNLRNMMAAGVDTKLISDAIVARRNGAHRVLPFRFIAAARACPQMEPYLDAALQASIADLPKLPGTTIVLIDVSDSMNQKLSGKSGLSRMDAAAALGAIVNCEHLRLLTFSNMLCEVPPRRGMAGVDAIRRSQPHMSTYLGRALTDVNMMPHDRLIVITDEQSHDRPGAPVAKNAYLINVASAKNGVGYGPNWTHFDGFSENVIRFIHELERERSGEA